MVRVMIAIPTAEYARRADFYDHLYLLEKPVECVMTLAHGQSPARNRNLMIQQAIDNNCSHILFIDDDVIVPPNIITKLLARDLDVVGGLQLMRHYPHRPIIFDQVLENGMAKWRLLKNEDQGLIEVLGMGLGCQLIKTSVFKKLEYPWIRLGELDKDHWCDDLGFYKRAREAGIKLFCDLDVLVGHIASVIVTPVRKNGEWFTSYDTKGEGLVNIPGASC